MKPMIAVWFSCGAASAVAAKKTIERYAQDHTIHILNNPILEEDPDNRRFLKDVEAWLGYPVETVTAKKYPLSSAAEVWTHRKFMSGNLGAPCTLELKKKARQEWEDEHHPDYHVLGFTFDEVKRHRRFVLTERSNVLPVLIDARITKQRCIEILLAAGLDLPRVYAMGYPNANCIGCVKATSSTYWNHVRKHHPDVFEQRAKQSRSLGTKLVRVHNKRTFLDELEPTYTNRSIKSLNFQCSLFCEENF